MLWVTIDLGAKDALAGCTELSRINKHKTLHNKIYPKIDFQVIALPSMTMWRRFLHIVVEDVP